MIEGNEDKFSKLFPHFFRACLNARDRELAKLENNDSNMRFIISNEPILDLFAISACAIIFSEVDSKNYSRVATTLWDDYYKMNIGGPEALSRYFKMVFDFSISIYSVLALSQSHSILRLEWKRDLKQQLQNRGLLNDDLTYYSHDEESPASRHPSAIIRVLIRRGFEMDTLEDFFYALYVMKRPEAKEIDWSRSRLADLADSFADEEHRGIDNKG